MDVLVVPPRFAAPTIIVDDASSLFSTSHGNSDPPMLVSFLLGTRPHLFARSFAHFHFQTCGHLRLRLRRVCSVFPSGTSKMMFRRFASEFCNSVVCVDGIGPLTVLQEEQIDQCD